MSDYRAPTEQRPMIEVRCPACGALLLRVLAVMGLFEVSCKRCKNKKFSFAAHGQNRPKLLVDK